MGELSTYSLIDFFPLSRPVYLRLFVRHNEAIWPAQVVTLVAVVAALVLLARGHDRWSGGLLGACWLVVAGTFFLQFYAELNWVARYAGWLFAGQGIALAAASFTAERRLSPSPSLPSNVGFGLAAAGVVALPLVGLAAGRSWAGLPVAGVAPDPTVVATLGALAAANRAPSWLFVVPTIWCFATGATAIALETTVELVAGGLGITAIGVALWRRWGRTPRD